jgi:hypothetical protein
LIASDAKTGWKHCDNIIGLTMSAPDLSAHPRFTIGHHMRQTVSDTLPLECGNPVITSVFRSVRL